MTPELADKIMTRIIARVEADGGVLHKSSGIEEIIGTCAVAESEGEIIDIISHDGEKWVHRDCAVFDVERWHERFLTGSDGNDDRFPWTEVKGYGVAAQGPAGMPGPFGVDMGDDRVAPAEPPDGAIASTPEGMKVRIGGEWISWDNYLFENNRANSAFADALAHGFGVQRIRLEDFKA